MANQFKPVILAQLGDPPPEDRAARDAVYARISQQFQAVLEVAQPAEREAQALAFGEAIKQIEAELAAGRTGGPSEMPVEPTQEERPQPEQQDKTAAPGSSVRSLLAVAVATFAIVAGASWYFFSPQRQQQAAAPVPANAGAPKDADVALTDKARSFHEALRSGDAGTAAFLLNSGYKPTRVELRAALLQVSYTPAIKAATASIDADIREVACGFTRLYEVRKPMTRPSLFDAEDAFSIMKQIGQDQWRMLCAGDSGRWRDALSKIEQQYAQYNKPEAEKKKQAEACIQKFGPKEASERWEQANCQACPESHSNCQSYCPQAPKAADEEEARFFSFNRADMSMAAMMSQATNRSRAEIYCNLQYLTKSTDFDLANLQRFRDLVSLFN